VPALQLTVERRQTGPGLIDHHAQFLRDRLQRGLGYLQFPHNISGCVNCQLSVSILACLRRPF
jgi:hypothetical protein